jgi:hypothetical protein
MVMFLKVVKSRVESEASTGGHRVGPGEPVLSRHRP